MNRLCFPIKPIAAAVILLVLAGCAGPRTQAPITGTDTGFPSPAAIEVFAAGFENVTDKYLDNLAIDDIGLEALRGLGSIDPAISVERDGDTIGLFGDGGEIVRLEYPDQGSPRAWAHIALEATKAARIWSDELKKADAEKIYEAVFDGMLSELDIYSRYSGAEEARRNRARRDGFGGIGIRFRLNGGEVEIVRVTPETPASEGGLKKGDVIISADGTGLAGLTVREISKILRGPIDTVVRLRIRPGREKTEKTSNKTAERDIDLTRRHIVPVTVTAKVEDDILFLSITSFNQKTADLVKRQVMNSRRNMGPRLRGVVMDLGGNPGGLLRQSIKLANLFLSQGHIITTRGRHPDSLHRYDAEGEDILEGLPLVVLVDGKSASAAEITAAALQDRNRAVVIGTSSYGKGSVQTVIRLPNDGELTITWSRLITPTGYTLHGLGVHPAVCTSSKARSTQTDKVRAAVDDADAAVDIFTQWRRPELLTKDERSRLRDICPPERHDNDNDRKVAKRILMDQALYSRALALTATTAQARGKRANW